jgi:hypothetical protein
VEECLGSKDEGSEAETAVFCTEDEVNVSIAKVE